MLRFFFFSRGIDSDSPEVAKLVFPPFASGKVLCWKVLEKVILFACVRFSVLQMIGE